MPADYTRLEATLEILLMLLAAFVLGWLFCWLMKKLFGRKQTETTEYVHDIHSAEVKTGHPERTGLSASSRERLYDPEVGIPRAEINPSNSEEATTIQTPELSLNDVDIPDIERPVADTKSPRPRIDIPDLKVPDIDLPEIGIKGKVDTGLDAGKDAIGKGIGAAAAGIGAVGVGALSLKDKAIETTEKIELPSINLMKNESNTTKTETDLPSIDSPAITTNFELPEADMPDLKVDAALPEVDLPEVELPSTDIDLPDINLPSTDIDIDLSELDLPETSVGINTPELELPSAEIPDVSDAVSSTTEDTEDVLSKGLGATTAGLGAITATAATLTNKTSDKADELEESLTTPDLPPNPASKEVADDARTIAEEDLTRISGIDSSIATLLSSKGINSYEKLRDTDRGTLKSYLEETDDQSLANLEPASWPHQAKLCTDKNWTKLSEYQSFLSGDSVEVTDTQSSTSFDETTKDDLKKIEGIGPFFESLLNKAGITTYQQLKQSDRDTLKQIIDAAGPDYRMHEPETWPYQAGLADNGDWKKLQDYINFMTGRN